MVNIYNIPIWVLEKLVSVLLLLAGLLVLVSAGSLIYLLYSLLALAEGAIELISVGGLSILICLIAIPMAFIGLCIILYSINEVRGDVKGW